MSSATEFIIEDSVLTGVKTLSEKMVISEGVTGIAPYACENN